MLGAAREGEELLACPRGDQAIHTQTQVIAGGSIHCTGVFLLRMFSQFIAKEETATEEAHPSHPGEFSSFD